MRTIGVIPARYASTRFPGKPLVPIGGKPLLQWVFEATQKSQKLDEILVATDDERIASLCEKMGAPYVLTDPQLPSGSDRVWAAIHDKDVDIVLNIQGDEPLIDPQLLDLLVEAFPSSLPSMEVATPRSSMGLTSPPMGQALSPPPKRGSSSIEMATLASPLDSVDLDSRSVVKVICNHAKEAIYFSRFPIPYSRQNGGFHGEQIPSLAETCFKHIGVYAYRKDFLGAFCQQEPVAIERAEGLEQLRALYMGARIHVMPVKAHHCGVDTMEDIKKVESKLKALE